MKQFRKNKEGLFLCEECDKKFKKLFWLSRHINKEHHLKIYYDKWIADENDEKCEICGELCEFKGFYGYKNTCGNKKCILEFRKLTCLNKFGVENPYQSEDIKIKISNTIFKKYGVDHNFKCPDIIEKRKKTWIKNLGVDNPLKNQDVKNKIRKTCLEKYGFEFTHQNRDILEKSQKSARYIHKFKETSLTYQGSYELDFLDTFYDKIKIENGPSIPYLFENNSKIYHSDFYAPNLNLIIEIKSTWILNIDNEVLDKKKACLNLGYNYIMILDKNYEEFIKLI